MSFIYLPLLRTGNGGLADAVLDEQVVSPETAAAYPLRGAPFNPRWQVRFLATLCPRCGAALDGEGDCLVLTCGNCDTAWQAVETGLERLDCRIVPGPPDTPLYLGFWKISAHLPSMGIWSFADFLQRTNQPIVSRREWHERVMHFWIPAFKLRPKIFLQAGRQTTLGQWRLEAEEEIHVLPTLYPVTLPESEARQALKVILAACATSPRKVFPLLPEVQPRDISSTLVYLPFLDRNHDWVQPWTGTVVAKTVLNFGRQL